MKKMAILREAEVEPSDTYPAPVGATGVVWSKLMSPKDYVLFLCLSELEEGAQLSWDDQHSDQALYVFSGALEVGDLRCEERSAVIVESNVPATVTATERSRIGHWGSWDAAVPQNGFNGPTSSEGHRIHVLGPKGFYRSGNPDDVAVRSFANSTCDTCRISLFEVTRSKKRAGRPHSHSADEIIFITDGLVELGSYKLGPGSSLCIPGGVRYAEGSGEGGAVFINYRRDASDRTDFVGGKATANAPEAATVRMGQTEAEALVDVFV
jgi:quercetin dioxygenase-like cupin family protein